jgi:hypothetical protein
MLSQIPLSQGTSGLRNVKLRPSRSMQCMQSGSGRALDIRETSISVAFSQLSLEDNRNDCGGNQVISTTMGPPPARLQKKSSNMNNSQPGLSETLDTPRACPESPRTPSQIPSRSKAIEDHKFFETPTKKLRKSPSKSSFSPYLNKESNVQNFTAWNVTERLDKMEGMYTNLKDTLESSVSERNSLEQEQSLLKAKGSCIHLNSIDIPLTKIVVELENMRSQLSSSNLSLQTDLKCFSKG